MTDRRRWCSHRHGRCPPPGVSGRGPASCWRASNWRCTINFNRRRVNDGVAPSEAQSVREQLQLSLPNTRGTAVRQQYRARVRLHLLKFWQLFKIEVLAHVRCPPHFCHTVSK